MLSPVGLEANVVRLDFDIDPAPKAVGRRSEWESWHDREGRTIYVPTRALRRDLEKRRRARTSGHR